VYGQQKTIKNQCYFRSCTRLRKNNEYIYKQLMISALATNLSVFIRETTRFGIPQFWEIPWYYIFGHFGCKSGTELRHPTDLLKVPVHSESFCSKVRTNAWFFVQKGGFNHPHPSAYSHGHHQQKNNAQHQTFKKNMPTYTQIAQDIFRQQPNTFLFGTG
jgi:hypothetical protein